MSKKKCHCQTIKWPLHPSRPAADLIFRPKLEEFLATTNINWGTLWFGAKLDVGESPMVPKSLKV